ncbi:MAG: [acyl-carrier-protein] S-malonyltransferase [Gammaproteobacteria bacterium]|jgi:[acyl-carrier-protein] S-malonyltransferase
MTKTAFVFPGQGAQSVGMMSDWQDYQPIVQNIYDEASESLGYNLWEIVSEGPAEKLNQTEITQPAMLCASVACWLIASAREEIPSISMMAGHSFGEYSALVCAGSLELEDAVKLVSYRGRLMQSAVPPGEGSMAAIIGLDDDSVIAACASVTSGVVEATNFNSIGQVVIAGNKVAVDEAMENAKALGAKRVLPLAVSVPSHCSLMTDAADQLFESLSNTNFKMPAIPVVHNQNADIANSVDDIKQLLKMQLYQPVRWADSVRLMHSKGIECLVECGPGKVLSGLTRRIEKTLLSQSVSDITSLEKTIESFTE